MKQGEQYSHRFRVDSTVYNGFIELFKDRNPLHTDGNFARKRGFAGEVMHGNILNGFLSYFIGELLPDKNVIIQKQEIKFLKPVYLDDELEFTAQVSEVFESVNTIEFKYRFTKIVENIKVANGSIQIGILKAQ